MAPGFTLRRIMMLKPSISMLLILFACLLQAQEKLPFYQIDLIIFTHQQASSAEGSLSSILPPGKSHTIALQTEVHKDRRPYHLLPASVSQLQQEYWALHRKPQYRILLHYSWLQPLNNQQTIELPKIVREGWELEGNLRVQRSNYYLLDTQLLFTTLTGNHTPFVLEKKQRLKGGEIYYLDHPQVGLLIKVHQVVT